jgi:tetratricopeptide (TPR) repeat protein
MRTIIIFIAVFFLQNISAQGIHNDFLKARSLMLVENYDSALHYLNMAEERTPGNIDITYNRALCYFELKKYEAALADLLFVNKRRPGMGSVMLAKTEIRLNHPELAIKYLKEHLNSHYKLPEKAILLDEDIKSLESSQAWKSLWKEKEWYSAFDKELQEIIHLKSRGENLEAINRLKTLEQKNFKRSLVNQYIAELYISLNNSRAAAEALEKSITADYRNIESLKLRIDLLEKKGDFENAAADCNRLLRQSPDEFDYYLIAGRINSKLGNYENAVESVKFYLNLYPQSSKGINELGLVYFSSGKYLDALKSFNKSLELETGIASYYYNRGRAYAATNMHKFASDDFAMALDLDPVDPEIWYSKAITDLALGKKDSACISFRKALQYGKAEANEYIINNCRN